MFVPPYYLLPVHGLRGVGAAGVNRLETTPPRPRRRRVELQRRAPPARPDPARDAPALDQNLETLAREREGAANVRGGGEGGERALTLDFFTENEYTRRKSLRRRSLSSYAPRDHTRVETSQTPTIPRVWTWATVSV